MRRILKWGLGSGAAAMLIAIVVAGVTLVLAVDRARDQVAGYLPAEPAEGGDGLSLADLSEWQIDVLLRVEDPDFWSHSGIDLSTPGAGMTTITQALVKRTFMFPFRPGPWNKLEQSVIARFALHPAVSKERQLEAFLNIAYFGEADGQPVIGFSGAARRYFQRPLMELDRRQYLTLVAMLIAPNSLRPDGGVRELGNRMARIESLLADECRADGVMDVWLESCDGG